MRKKSADMNPGDDIVFVNHSDSPRENADSCTFAEVPIMNDRVADITEYILVSDGLMQSHKSYKIVTRKKDNSSVIQIMRRYSDFEWLVFQLTEKYPGYIIPPLPAKNILTNINQENEEFIESRKHGLKYFLQKMLQHYQLRYAPDFVSFVCKNDTEFGVLVEKSKKNPGLIPKIANIVDYVSSVPGYNFFSSIVTSISGGSEKVKREKKDIDVKLENYERYVVLLEQNATDLASHLSHLVSLERDYSNTMIDVGANFMEIIKLDKEFPQEKAGTLNSAIEKEAKIQKSFAKQLNEEFEIRINDISRYAGSAREALERRNTLVDVIGKNEQKLSELRKQKIDSDKMEELKRLNEENKRKQSEMDAILPIELENFKNEMNQEFAQLVEEFSQRKMEYTEKILSSWVLKKSE